MVTVTMPWYERIRDPVIASLLGLTKSEPPLEIKQQGRPSPLPGNETAKALDRAWVITMSEGLKRASQDDEARLRKNPVISRVPPLLLRARGDSKAYVPQVVSIGPYHCRIERLWEMNHHKWRALRRALDRDKNHELEDYLRAVKDIEEKAQACYEGSSLEFERNKFAEIMLLDGCFVIELLRGATRGYRTLGYLPDDPVFARRGSLFHSVQRDMIKLENQLPLSVLDKLLGLQLGKPDQKGAVAELVTPFFNTLMPTSTNESFTNIDGNQSESPDHSSLHILDIFRESLVRTRSNEGRGFWFLVALVWAILVEEMLESIMTFAECFKGEQQSIRTDELFESQQLIHCTTQLREAGIDFKERKKACFWDIKFNRGILEIPPLLIDDGTESLLHNLIAFEQCHPDRGNKITSYAVFMDNLINSEQDVAYLHSRGIIKHWLGSDAEVAKLFNGLCQEVVFDSSNSYLSGLSKNLNRYYGCTWNTWRASLKHKYFSNPWAFISFLAAVFLLLLTFLQTFYGVYGYYKPR